MSLPGGAQSCDYHITKTINQCINESSSHVRTYTKESSSKPPTGSPLPTPKITLFNGKLDSKWNLERIGTGLVNMGNTCFLASVLQCLSHIPMFYNYVMSHSVTRDCGEFCIVCSMKCLLKLLFTQISPVEPSSITRNLLKIADHMVMGEQEDAHDFLLSFLNAFQKRLVPERLQNDDFIANTSAIGHMFNGYLRSQIVCQGCKKASNTYEPTFNLSLEIKGFNSLEAALENYFRADSMGNGLWYDCCKCKTKTKAYKKYSLEVLPKILIFQLNRYEFGSFGKVKITDRVSYKRQLNMSKYLSSKEDNASYHLHSVIIHRGSQMGSGHYLCCVAHPKFIGSDGNMNTVNINNSIGSKDTKVETCSEVKIEKFSKDCKLKEQKENVNNSSSYLPSLLTNKPLTSITTASCVSSFSTTNTKLKTPQSVNNTLGVFSPTYLTNKLQACKSSNLPPSLFSSSSQSHDFSTVYSISAFNSSSTNFTSNLQPDMIFSHTSTINNSFSFLSSNELPSSTGSNGSKWFYMNDEMVTETNWESVSSEQAYLLFYIKDDNQNNLHNPKYNSTTGNGQTLNSPVKFELKPSSLPIPSTTSTITMYLSTPSSLRVSSVSNLPVTSTKYALFSSKLPLFKSSKPYIQTSHSSTILEPLFPTPKSSFKVKMSEFSDATNKTSQVNSAISQPSKAFYKPSQVVSTVFSPISSSSISSSRLLSITDDLNNREKDTNESSECTNSGKGNKKTVPKNYRKRRLSNEVDDRNCVSSEQKYHKSFGHLSSQRIHSNRYHCSDCSDHKKFSHRNDSYKGTWYARNTDRKYDRESRRTRSRSRRRNYLKRSNGQHRNYFIKDQYWSFSRSNSRRRRRKSEERKYVSSRYIDKRNVKKIDSFFTNNSYNGFRDKFK